MAEATGILEAPKQVRRVSAETASRTSDLEYREGYFADNIRQTYEQSVKAIKRMGGKDRATLLVQEGAKGPFDLKDLPPPWVVLNEAPRPNPFPKDYKLDMDYVPPKGSSVQIDLAGKDQRLFIVWRYDKNSTKYEEVISMDPSTRQTVRGKAVDTPTFSWSKRTVGPDGKYLSAEVVEFKGKFGDTLNELGDQSHRGPLGQRDSGQGYILLKTTGHNLERIGKSKVPLPLRPLAR